MPRSLSTAFKAARQLGISSLYHYARYQVGLYSSYYAWKSRPASVRAGPIRSVLKLPSRQALFETLGERAQILIGEANEVVQGRVRLFGSPPVPLELVPPGELVHWTAYANGVSLKNNEVEDIKIIWEPARFGWAYTLGRAYLLTGDEQYAQAFWMHTETFLDSNPAYQGPNWFSGQEAALRLLALVFASQTFQSSYHSTGDRMARLSQAIAQHAARLPLTLVYAKAQNNNHLLTEAAGLYTAGLALPEHPDAKKWMELGWREFNQALQDQVSLSGTYIQHSTNYHRLMLQTLLWVVSLIDNRSSTRPLPPKSQDRAAAATRWLMSLVDPDSGGAPNLGPNDGAYILPFSTSVFRDFRPVVQAAASTILGIRPYPPSPGDEMCLWLNGKISNKSLNSSSTGLAGATTEPHILRNHDFGSWLYLRAASFTSRPGHADQLHIDLWWKGENIALDPGTYRYTASYPWDNSLARTEVHNTVCINRKDQMRAAGRFLWLDWAQAQVLDFETGEDGSLYSLTAQHDGYYRDGLIHRRTVSRQEDGWQVQDHLLPSGIPGGKDATFEARLHWLLPDWPWQIAVENTGDTSSGSFTLKVKSPQGWIRLRVQVLLAPSNSSRIQLIRAGELLQGESDVSPTLGWFSPTYNVKVPALSFSVILNCQLPVRLVSRWIFPA